MGLNFKVVALLLLFYFGTNSGKSAPCSHGRFCKGGYRKDKETKGDPEEIGIHDIEKLGYTKGEANAATSTSLGEKTLLTKDHGDSIEEDRIDIEGHSIERIEEVKLESMCNLFLRLPDNTKVVRSFDNNDETITLKKAINEILNDTSVAEENMEWKMLDLKRPLPRKLITRDCLEMNMSLLKIGNGMDVTIAMLKEYPHTTSSNINNNSIQGMREGIRRRVKKSGSGNKFMTLESSGRYVECDKGKRKNNEYWTGGSTVMLSGEEDDDDEEEDQG